jgi:hypothetical protein
MPSRSLVHREHLLTLRGASRAGGDPSRLPSIEAGGLPAGYFRLQWPGCARVDALPPAALASLVAAPPGDPNSDPDWVRVQSLPLRTAQP